MLLEPTLNRFQKETLTEPDAQTLARIATRLRSDILELIAAAGSGHIGGSYSTLDVLLLTCVCAKISPKNAETLDRDRIVVSHGHISPAVYTVLAALGYFPREELFREYRKVPGKYEGHPSITAPGVDWGSGSLGQGLSVGCGMALAARMRGDDAHAFVFMGDGEQDKGQMTEAMALAAKYCLGNLTAIVDCNGLQCTGSVEDVLPLHLEARYRAYGWRVLSVDGHDYRACYQALRAAYHSSDRPCVILAKTVMGKGLPIIENDRSYHGGFLNTEQLAQARTLFAEYANADPPVIRKPGWISGAANTYRTEMTKPLVYQSPTSGRAAAGRAVLSASEQMPSAKRPVVVDCDVAPSTGLAEYYRVNPDRFVECGIAEQNAATVSAAIAVSGLTALFSTFAMFSLGEPYGQIRSANMNHAPLKILATHCGLDVGPDGKTHQCLDYIGLCANFMDFELIIPGDANQADRAMRYLLASPSAGALAVGRSIVPVIRTEDGSLFYGEDRLFQYGQADWIRHGSACTIVSYGTLLPDAAEAVDRLRSEGVRCGLLNVSCPLALDREQLLKAAALGPVIVFEDHNAETGLGARIAALFMETQCMTRLVRMGMHQYGGSADASVLYHQYGLDQEALIRTVQETLAQSERNNDK